MISKIKKPVSILLALMMIVSLFAVVPITASAAEETSTVTWDNSSLQKTSGGKSSGGVTLTTEQAQTRVNDCFYSGRGTATFTAPEGSVFTKIELRNCRYINSLNFPGATVANDGGYWEESMWDDEDPRWVQYYKVTWTGESSEVTFSGAVYGIQSIVFTLKSVAPTTYTVTWKNGETTLRTDTVNKDAIPAYSGDVPTKAEDAQYSYTFTGWTDGTNTYGKDATLPAVTANVIYTATFASEDKAVKNVITLINALPAAAEITAADKAKIEAARAAYDELNGDQKTLVTNLDKLTAAETALAAAEKLFPQHSITLGGNIGVNFFINSKTADFASDENAYVKFTWDNGTYNKEVKLKDLPRDNNGNYMASVDVVAAQMAHKIHAEVYLNGEKLDQSDDYSVQDYAEAVYANPGDYTTPEKAGALKELAKAMLNYGAMAQTVFAEALKDHPAFANKTVGNNGYEGVTAEQIGDAVKGTSADLNKVAEKLDAEFYTSSLIYLSRNTLRLYFTPASKTVGALDGKGFSDSLSGYYYYVDHENIPAAELDEQKELTVGDYTFTYTALDYAKAVVNSGMGGDQKNLAKALYLYNKAANAFFDEPAPAQNIVDLSTITEDTVVEDGYTITGTLKGDYKISIAENATVTLKDANIAQDFSAESAGITLLGDATILLEGTNTVMGGYGDYPGIYVPANTTLTIDGDGSLTASGQENGCGIGGGYDIAAGNIVINGGTITATGGEFAAGIGSGNLASCGNITINGGTVAATGGSYGAGIGSGYGATCGNIMIADTVTQVTATKGEDAPNSIGAGYNGSCGTVTIEDNSKVTQN